MVHVSPLVDQQPGRCPGRSVVLARPRRRSAPTGSRETGHGATARQGSQRTRRRAGDVQGSRFARREARMFRAAWRRGETASRPEAPGDDDVSSERAVEWLRVLGTTERTGLTALLPENVPNEW